MSGQVGAARPVGLFTPKILTVLREGYGPAGLRADIVAGLTVAIVALPLSMAIAIASGVGPERGLYTAIVGGFLVSLLGGSRFQIGGPAGAFIVLVSATVDQFGVDGLILATALSGVILLAIGALRLGSYITYIPYPVTVGFTAGIGVIIFASQMKDLFGLVLQGKEPGALLPKLGTLAAAWPSASPTAIGVAGLSIAIILTLRRLRPHWPALLIAVAVASLLGLAVAGTGARLATIGTAFGGIPHSLPAPEIPAFTMDKLAAVLPMAVSFALLGSIESLLSAVVADSMSGRRHRSNMELVAQGIANIGSALFGGICVTGTIARTATNVRAGARGPVAGMLHAVFLLLFLLLAAPLASAIPLAALAAVLAVVSWNMIERHAIGILLRASRGDALVLAVTFLLVVFRDLTEGIVVGFALSALLFLHRMAGAVAVERGEEAPFGVGLATDSDIAVHRISGAFFFGAAAAVSAAMDRIGERPRAHVVDLSGVAVLDSSGAAAIEGFVRRARQSGAAVYVSGADRAALRTLLRHGIRPPVVRFRSTLQAAVGLARAGLRPS